MHNTLENQIEALLFFKGESMSIAELAKTLKKQERDVAEAVESLKKTLANRGIRLMEKEGNVLLATAPETSELIEAIQKEELVKDLGKAGRETLTIVLYKGPIGRAEIDYIRGVNSTYIIRHLLIRGLIEKVLNPKNKRSFLYKPTFDLLSFLGITNIKDLPEYESVQKELAQFEKALREEEGHEAV